MRVRSFDAWKSTRSEATLDVNLRPFSKLYFGEAAAEDEAEKRPQLFLRGYYDLAESTSKIELGDAFLLIGPKGAGKSSFVEYLRLKAEETPHSAFVVRRDLGELRGALKNDASMAAGSELTELAWSTWIWCQVFDSLVSDQSSSLHSDLEVIELHRQLKLAGILAGDFASVIKEVQKKQHKFVAPKVYEFSVESSGERKVNIGQLRDVLVAVCCRARTENNHTLALDGLDSAVIGSSGYWQQLAALLRATNVTHRHIRKAESNLRVVLLCRSDIFIKIPLPDSNKIRQSWGIELKWSYGRETPEDSYLWDLIEKKASATGRPVTHLIASYFPQKMLVGDRTRPRQIEMHRYLMDLTRGTPRDMIMLLKKIQDQSREVTELTVNHIRAGVNAYCEQYFAGEIGDELVGLLPSEVATTVIGALSRLPRRQFSRADAESVFTDHIASSDTTLDALLQQLFLAGAIANIEPGRNEDYVKFYHRRNYAELSLSGPFILHTALALSLNRQFGGQATTRRSPRKRKRPTS